MKRNEIVLGARDAIPIVLGYLPLGMTFGVLAGEVGLSIFQATMMSVLCFTGAGQYIAIGVIKAGGAVFTIIIANILVNIRYFLFATSLVPKLKGRVPTFWAALLSYGLTDETYAVSINRYQDHPPSTEYMAALNLTSHAGWISSTLLGAWLGAFISNTEQLGLNFALPAMYLCLLFMVTNRRSDIYVAILTAVLCLLVGYLLPSSMQNLSNIIIATIIGATVGVFLRDRS